MGKIKMDEAGFSPIEIVMVLIIAVLIGTVGYMVYKNHGKTTTPAMNTTSTKPTSMLQDSTITSGPESGWKTYTNNKIGFSIAYPDNVESNNGCSTASTLSSGSVLTTLIQDGSNFYIAAKDTYRFTLTWGANQTYDMSGCTQVPTDANSVRSYNNQVTTGAQYIYFVYNLPFLVKKVSNESSVQTELQSYWNDSTIVINGWKNDPSGNYQVPTAIDCSPAEEGMGNNCGPTSSNHDLRYYPAQKIMFYYVQGQAPHLTFPGNVTSPDSQIVSSFKLLN